MQSPGMHTMDGFTFAQEFDRAAVDSSCSRPPQASTSSSSSAAAATTAPHSSSRRHASSGGTRNTTDQHTIDNLAEQLRTKLHTEASDDDHDIGSASDADMLVSDEGVRGVRARCRTSGSRTTTPAHPAARTHLPGPPPAADWLLPAASTNSTAPQEGKNSQMSEDISVDEEDVEMSMIGIEEEGGRTKKNIA
jgi:hypothetical protein